MKKSLLALTLSVALMFGIGNAYAWGTPKTATASAYINPGAAGGSGDSAYDKSDKLTWFNLNKGGDDEAWARGGSEGAATNLGSADAGTLFPFKNTTAFATGDANAQGATKAGALAVDIGLRIPFFNIPLGPQVSIAGSAIGTVVNVNAEGESGFAGKGILGGGIAYNESSGMVMGGVERGSMAQENSFGKTWAQSQENSSADFYGTAIDKDLAIDAALCGSYDGTARSSIDMTGGAFSAGGSIAYIEPNGNTQSAFAATGNMAVTGIQGADYTDNHVRGDGDAAIQSYADNKTGHALSGANGSFSYSGTQAGVGATIMQSSATVGNNSFSSQASGTSFATSK